MEGIAFAWNVSALGGWRLMIRNGMNRSFLLVSSVCSKKAWSIIEISLVQLEEFLIDFILNFLFIYFPSEVYFFNK